jgi:hypothetical protein
MLDIRNKLESIGLKIKLPMKLELDNKGANDINKNWSFSGRIRHVGEGLRELKENKIIEIQWYSTHETSYILTTNLSVNLCNNHSKLFSVDGHDPELILWEDVESIENTSRFESRVILDDDKMT